ncbi:MAG: hypothetical protein JSS53_02365 [Proteobacteria bacterium]|nr:hypothetical protein [Pseudomonadota bacterium]
MKFLDLKLPLDLQSLAKLFRDVCLLKKGPQDIPYSVFLLILLCFLDFGQTLLFDMGLNKVQKALDTLTLINSFKAILRLASSGLFVFIVLQIKQLSSRWIQTFTTMVGCNVLINIVAFPLIVLLFTIMPTEEAAAPSSMLSSLIFIFTIISVIAAGVWSILVNAHIFKHALNIKFFMGVLMTFACSGFTILIVNFF